MLSAWIADHLYSRSSPAGLLLLLKPSVVAVSAVFSLLEGCTALLADWLPRPPRFAKKRGGTARCVAGGTLAGPGDSGRAWFKGEKVLEDDSSGGKSTEGCCPGANGLGVDCLQASCSGGDSLGGNPLFFSRASVMFTSNSGASSSHGLPALRNTRLIRDCKWIRSSSVRCLVSFGAGNYSKAEKYLSGPG